MTLMDGFCIWKSGWWVATLTPRKKEALRLHIKQLWKLVCFEVFQKVWDNRNWFFFFSVRLVQYILYRTSGRNINREENHYTWKCTDTWFRFLVIYSGISAIYFRWALKSLQTYKIDPRKKEVSGSICMIYVAIKMFIRSQIWNVSSSFRKPSFTIIFHRTRM